MRGSRGGQGFRTPTTTLKNKKNIGLPSNIGQDPVRITKLPSQHSMFGHHRHASETPFKWRFADGPMVARLKWYLNPPHQLNKNDVKVGRPLTKLSGSAHDERLFSNIPMFQRVAVYRKASYKVNGSLTQHCDNCVQRCERCFHHITIRQ